MRSGTMALLLGILSVQQLPALGDEFFVQFLPLVLFIGIFCRSLRLPALFVVGLLWAVFRGHLAAGGILPPALDGAEVVAVGRVVGVPQTLARRTRFEFRVASIDAPEGATPAAAFAGKTRLYWYDAPPLEAGERWRLRLRMRAPRGHLNPGGFDYERWLFVRGIRATGYVRSGGEALLLDRGHRLQLHRWRQRAADKVVTSLPGREFAGIIAALSVGVRSRIEKDHWRVLRDTGTAHLMAISGLHVGLVATLAFLLTRVLWGLCFRLCLWLPAQRAAAATGLAAGAAYAAMAGFALPTQRALIMLAVVMWCLSRNRVTAFSVVLCAALAAVILIDPFSVLGPSLWLSFAAVAVLAFGMLPRQRVDKSGLRGLWWRWGWAQCLAALGLAPILMATFGQQPLLAPLANLLAIPWTACLVVPGAIAGTALAHIWPQAGEPVLALTAGLLEFLWPALELLAGLDHTLTASAGLSLIWLAAAVVGVFILLLPAEFPGRWIGVLWMAPLIGLAPPAPPPGGLWLTVLDVGHGLAVVARTRQRVLLFDAGPRYSGGFDAGAGTVAPYLRSQGIRRIDTVLISHSDNDHAGGLNGLLAHIPAAAVLGPAQSGIGDACGEGGGWRWEGYEFRLLHPPRTPRYEGNDASCVLRISGPGGSVLIPGDIEAPAEKRLVARYGEALASDVLVAPHHGSRTSSTEAFIRAVSPTYVLFSASHRRRPRLPDAHVMARYLALGAKPLVTWMSGAVSIELSPDAPPRPSLHRPSAARYWRPAIVAVGGAATLP